MKLFLILILFNICSKFDLNYAETRTTPDQQENTVESFQEEENELLTENNDDQITSETPETNDDLNTIKTTTEFPKTTKIESTLNAETKNKSHVLNQPKTDAPVTTVIPVIPVTPVKSVSKPKKGLINSLTKGAKGIGKNAFGLIKRNGDEDAVLKAYKGGDENQNEEDQKETDGFFSQFRNLGGRENGKACFKNIGCFSAAEYNDFISRPIPVLPMSPDLIQPNFHIYTLEARSIPRNYTYNASPSSLKYSTFNPKLKTAFIIHGFQSGFSLWMEYLKDFIQYQSGDGFNVIVVVWENGARQAYSTAAANTRVVGACIGYFIETLCKTFSLTNDKFYLIGHGLGGHAAGYAGKRLHNPKINRITALDPAGIGFLSPNPSMRLDSGDASIVDIIHTDAIAYYTDGFGTKDTNGHYDFFPNGGSWQPGCSDATGIVQKLGQVNNAEEITCSHTRGITLPYNLNKPEDDCVAVAYQCPNYEMFLEGRCADCRDYKCQLMGINPSYWWTQKTDNKTLGKSYFIQTSNREEFCLYHYQFGVHTTNFSDSTTGILVFNVKVKLPGSDQTKDLQIERIMTKTYQRKIHTFLITFDFRIEKFISLDLQWHRYNSSERYRVNRGYKLIIPYIEINFMSHLEESVRQKHSTVLCSNNEKIIVNKETKHFKECQPSLDQKASETRPEQMIALEWKEDIYSVDFMKSHRVFHKISKTRIREKLKRNEIVD